MFEYPLTKDSEQMTSLVSKLILTRSRCIKTKSLLDAILMTDIHPFSLLYDSFTYTHTPILEMLSHKEKVIELNKE